MSVTREPPGEQATALVRDGRTYFAQGDFERARACYAAAVEIAPDDMTARAGLARCERLLAESREPLDDGGAVDEYGFDAGPKGGATMDLGPEATIVDALGALRLETELERSAEPIAPPDPRLLHQPTGAPTVDTLPIAALGSGAPPRLAARHAAGLQSPDLQGDTAVMGQHPSASGPLQAIPQYAPAPGTPLPYHGAPGYGMPVPLGAPRPNRFWIGIAVAIGVVGAGLGLLIRLRGVRRRRGREPGRPRAGEGRPAAGADRARRARARPDRNPAGARERRLSTRSSPLPRRRLHGEVARVHVKAGGTVTTGQKLYTLRDGTGVRAAEVAVEAAAAGRIERRAARGEKVQKGTVLAQLVDPEVWQVVADVSSEDVATSWSCAVASGDGRERAPCRVEGVQKLGAEQSRVTASVSASAAWLQRGGELVLSVSPTGAASAGP